MSTLPVFIYRVTGDMLIIRWPDTAADFLAHLDQVLLRISASDPQQMPESARNFLLLVRDAAGYYQGCLPTSGQVADEPQPHEIVYLNETDEYRAMTKLLLAYDLGPDTKPNL